MIYIVTGTQRSGTSMMMKCLIEGGIEPYFDQDKEAALRESHPETNKGGFYELSVEEIASIDFPLPAEGKLIKFLSPWRVVGLLSPAKYRIIFMKRDPREVALSTYRLNGGMISTQEIDVLNQYDALMDKGIALANNRKDVESVNVVDYNDLLKAPFEFFDSLCWPIDPEKAARCVDGSVKETQTFNTPFSGDLYKDLGINQTLSATEVIASGIVPGIPQEVVEKAKNGTQFELVEQH